MRMIESKHVHVKVSLSERNANSPATTRANDYPQLSGGKWVAGIYGVDTRAITRLLLSYGVMRGIITCETPQQALQN